MSRLVLRYTGPGAPPADDLRVIRDVPGLVVVDTSDRMVLVDSSVAVVRAALGERAWTVSRERTYAAPRPRRPGRARG